MLVPCFSTTAVICLLLLNACDNFYIKNMMIMITRVRVMRSSAILEPQPVTVRPVPAHP